ncbi:MAG TPA: hypothetical protein VIL43_04085 [Burkholderiales bacterium]
MGALVDGAGAHLWTWTAVIALGAYHGVNPAMGWLLAVSNGMQARRASAVFRALPPIAAGHVLAMVAALLPFALLGVYVERLEGLRGAAALLLIGFGLYKLRVQRHPRLLARIGPSQLTLWSFLMATAHGAGLMLVPVVLGLQAGGDPAHAARMGHHAPAGLAGGGFGLVLAAALIHTAAMVVAGGAIAWIVYRYVGLGLLRRAWFNLELLWAMVLVAVGAAALAAVLR